MEKLTIREIEEKLISVNGPDSIFMQTLLNDERKGVQQLLNKWLKWKEQERKIFEKYLLMTKYEKKYLKQGYQFIAGVDEVGRGPLAGPVVASAVILPADFYLPGIDDSKKLSEQKRNEYFAKIHEKAIAVSIGIVDVNEIDQINIYEASKKAMLAAISGLHVQPDFVLVDAVKLDTPYPLEAIIKGDGKSVSIAAASIIAKVTRDRMMTDLGKEYEAYGFAKHMGYGTKAHLEAIRKYGITRHHRKSFAPIKNYVKKE
ncbi:ribonuclease HII [Cytobacillus eiseniae]|uniref:Ribonuclease HII n=1 Tax=Cytobacillus eiseniae TaxID=762947 RepID=A0ABS4RBM0_9BACI|nr:ribonuclease HII [Cytobacillus eiseniae]MBP2240109.1 ribonuclease HII [Cytobacillus eiseniae]